VVWSWQDVLIHVLALPVYQILGTIRHEGSHAIAALLYGRNIVEFRFLPGRRDDGHWYWGYVGFDGPANGVILLAPSIAAAASVICWFKFVRPLELGTHWWLFTTIALLASPIVDTLYNLGKWVFQGRGDFAQAFAK
jgi:hypothetical protein